MRIFESQIELSDLQSRSKENRNVLKSYLAINETEFNHFKKFRFEKYEPFDIPELSSFQNTGIAPNIRIAQLQVNKAQQEVDKEISNYNPTIGAFAKYGNNNRTEFGAERRGEEYSFGLSLKWEIASAYKNHYEIKKKIIEGEVLKSELDESKLESEKKINSLYSQAIKWNKQRTLSKALYELVQEKTELASEEFKAGLITDIELDTVNIEVLEKELSMKLAEIELKKAILLLELFLDQKIVPARAISSQQTSSKR